MTKRKTGQDFKLSFEFSATINLNRNALYQGVATVFLAEVYRIHLGSLQLLTVMITVVAASIGTPSISGVGMVVFSVILESVGISTSGIAFIMGVDRIFDMSRTAVNRKSRGKAIVRL